MKTLEEIKKEYELKFGTNSHRMTFFNEQQYYWNNEFKDEMWQFIESTISQTKQELIEEIKEWSDFKYKNVTGASVVEDGKFLDKGTLYYDGYNEAINELDKFLEKLSNK